MIARDQNRAGSSEEDFDARIDDDARVCEIIAEAGRAAVQVHARAGREIPVWREGQVVWVRPELDTPQTVGNDAD